jgi:tetratricopeptide (TPR) repeat protein
MKRCIIDLFYVVICVTNIYAQRDEVNKYLLLAAKGDVATVKEVILELLAKYPNDAGVKLLHATIIDNAYLALEMYKNILTNYPASEWADDAYWRTVQFYAILGDTAKAKGELENFRKGYPNSPFLGPASDVVRSAIGIAKSDTKNAMKATFEKTGDAVNKERTLKAEEAAKLKAEDNKTVEVKKADDSKIDEAKVKPIEKTSINSIPKESSNTEIKKEIETTKVVLVPPSENRPQFYGLQVAIYSDKDAAESEKNKYLTQRMRTQVVDKVVDGKTMYAVVIGNYSSNESAEAAKIIVAQQCKCEPIIYKK